jgi:hypothetical protein
VEIKLNYTQEELSTLLDGLNNALLSLDQNYNAIRLGAENVVPDEIRKLNLDEETMRFRLAFVKGLYDYLLTYE